AMPSTAPRSSERWAGGRGRRSRRGCARPSAGTRSTPTGSRRRARENTSVNTNGSTGGVRRRSPEPPRRAQRGNQAMELKSTVIPDVILIQPKVFPDDRGYFLESFQTRKYARVGVTGPMVQ